MTMRLCRSAVGATALAVALTTLPAHALITAGPQGQFQTVQAAINALLASGSEVELRIQGATTFNERLILSIGVNRAFKISGGWNPTFTAQSASASSSVLDAARGGRAFDIHVNAGSLTLNTLTIQNGLIIEDGSGGGGIRLITGGPTVQATLANLVIDNNIAITTSSTANFTGVGGGIIADAQLGSIELDGPMRISNNRALSFGGGAVLGGGAFLRTFANGSMSLLGTPAQPIVIDRNVADGGNNALAYGGGCEIDDFSHMQLRSVEITRNTVRGPYGYRSGCDVSIGTGSTFSLAQSALFANVEDTQNHLGTSQAYFYSGQNANIDVTDSVVSQGADAGLHLGGGSGTLIRLVNLSISGNASGLLLDSVNGVTLHNSIVAQNSADLAPPLLPAGDHNFIGGDPHFIAGDPYLHIQADSPARDAGNDTPPGGLSAADIDGGTRLFQSHVDIGADEIGDPIFANGFEP